MKKNSGSLFLILLLIVLALTACNSQPTSLSVPTLSTREVINNGNSTSGQVANSVVAESLDELIAKSPIILIGKMQGKGEIINGARDTNDISKATNEFFAIGQVYSIKVERYLKGSGETDINLIQTEGGINSIREAVTQEKIDKVLADSKVIKLRSSERYLFFLTTVSGFAEQPGKTFHIPAISPWRFRFTNKNEAEPETASNGKVKEFNIQPSATLIQEVERVVNLKPTVAPTPTAEPIPTQRAKPGDGINLVKLYNLDKTVIIELVGPTKNALIKDSNQIKNIVDLLGTPVLAIERKPPTARVSPEDLVHIIFKLENGSSLYFEYNRNLGTLLLPPSDRFNAIAPAELAKALNWN